MISKAIASITAKQLRITNFDADGLTSEIVKIIPRQEEHGIYYESPKKQSISVYTGIGFIPYSKLNKIEYFPRDNSYHYYSAYPCIDNDILDFIIKLKQELLLKKSNLVREVSEIDSSIDDLNKKQRKYENGQNIQN